MKRAFRILYGLVSTVVTVAVVLAAVALVAVRLLNYETFTVLSGSMEPAIQTGSLIYVRPVDSASIKVGDIISYMLDEDTVATHRVVKIASDPADASVLRFTTKGDANSSSDANPVHSLNVIGKPVLTIPYLGYAVSFIKTPPGIYYAVAIVALFLLLAFLPGISTGKNVKEAQARKAD